MVIKACSTCFWWDHNAEGMWRKCACDNPRKLSGTWMIPVIGDHCICVVTAGDTVCANWRRDAEGDNDE